MVYQFEQFSLCSEKLDFSNKNAQSNKLFQYSEGHLPALVISSLCFDELMELL